MMNNFIKLEVLFEKNSDLDLSLSLILLEWSMKSELLVGEIIHQMVNCKNRLKNGVWNIHLWFSWNNGILNLKDLSFHIVNEIDVSSCYRNEKISTFKSIFKFKFASIWNDQPNDSYVFNLVAFLLVKPTFCLVKIVHLNVI